MLAAIAVSLWFLLCPAPLESPWFDVVNLEGKPTTQAIDRGTAFSTSATQTDGVVVLWDNDMVYSATTGMDVSGAR